MAEELQFRGMEPDPEYWGLVEGDEGTFGWKVEVTGSEGKDAKVEVINFTSEAVSGNYRRISQLNVHGEEVRVWPKAFVYKGENGEVVFARRTKNNKHELLTGAIAAAAGAVTLGAVEHLIRKHHKKD